MSERFPTTEDRLHNEYETLSSALSVWRGVLDQRRDFATRAYEALIERHARVRTEWFLDATCELYALEVV